MATASGMPIFRVFALQFCENATTAVKPYQNIKKMQKWGQYGRFSRIIPSGDNSFHQLINIYGVCLFNRMFFCGFNV